MCIYVQLCVYVFRYKYTIFILRILICCSLPLKHTWYEAGSYAAIGAGAWATAALHLGAWAGGQPWSNGKTVGNYPTNVWKCWNMLKNNGKCRKCWDMLGKSFEVEKSWLLDNILCKPPKSIGWSWLSRSNNQKWKRSNFQDTPERHFATWVPWS